MTNSPLMLVTLALFAAACGSSSGTDSGPEEGEPYAQMALHDGYWVTEVEQPEVPMPITVINDMHIDTETRRVTVYAQARALGQTVSPPQVGPGECAEAPTGATVCFHPDAVYLNGSGAELAEADGTGAWWVKHSWIVDGEGYDNCELMPPQEVYDSCGWVEGILLDDGLSMQVGNERLYNIRVPLLDADPITYQVTRYEVEDGESTPTAGFDLIFDCVEEPSALDNQTRPCPTAP